MGITYQYGTVRAVGRTAFWWAVEGVLPCYILPYLGANVPAGIDGLEFV